MKDTIERQRPSDEKAILLAFMEELSETNELCLIEGIKYLSLLKQHKHDQIKEIEYWTPLCDIVNAIYGDISYLIDDIGLTPQEMKVCYLTLCRFKSSEQAEILILEEETIKKYKSRIKKKMKLGEEVSLSVHLFLSAKHPKVR